MECSNSTWHGWHRSHKSAVVIIPPEDCWSQIQDIRRKHDRAYERWMPHINLIYPFIESTPDGQSFAEASESMTAALAHIKPLVVRFGIDSFRCFRHNKNSCTLWLKPTMQLATNSATSTDSMPSLQDYSDMHRAVIEVQRNLQDMIDNDEPGKDECGAGFVPHLSLGQFQLHEIESFAAELRHSWSEIVFEVSMIHIISRDGFHDPFTIRKTVCFGNRPMDTDRLQHQLPAVVHTVDDGPQSSGSKPSQSAQVAEEKTEQVSTTLAASSSAQNEITWGGLTGLRFSL